MEGKREVPKNLYAPESLIGQHYNGIQGKSINPLVSSLPPFHRNS